MQGVPSSNLGAPSNKNSDLRCRGDGIQIEVQLEVQLEISVADNDKAITAKEIERQKVDALRPQVRALIEAGKLPDTVTVRYETRHDSKHFAPAVSVPS